jgi:adenine deaminase
LAVEAGIDPVAAIQMATINAARYYRVDHELGSVSPGKQADFVLVDDLETFSVRAVIVGGQPVVLDGEVVATLERPTYPAFLKNTVRLSRPMTPQDFRLAAPAHRDEVTVRVIGAETLVSDERHIRMPVINSVVEPDTSRDVLEIAMVDRYGRSGRVAVGFLQGYGLKHGALGTTYNPMYHNIVVLGTNAEDMAVAANALADMSGGFVAVDGGKVVAAVPLTLLGLMSDETADVFVADLEHLYSIVRDMGCTMPSPYHNLAFTCVCGELPRLKLSHLGLFDVLSRQVLPTIVDET